IENILPASSTRPTGLNAGRVLTGTLNLLLVPQLLERGDLLAVRTGFGRRCFVLFVALRGAREAVPLGCAGGPFELIGLLGRETGRGHGLPTLVGLLGHADGALRRAGQELPDGGDL